MRHPVDPKGHHARRNFVAKLREEVRALRARARAESRKLAAARVDGAETETNERRAWRAQAARAVRVTLAELGTRRLRQGAASAVERRLAVAKNARAVRAALAGYRERRGLVVAVRHARRAGTKTPSVPPRVPTSAPTFAPVPAPVAARVPVALAPQVARPVVTVLPPTPDDFTQLQGIGPGIHRRLHDAGITTFARLAVCTPDELHALFGLQLAFASWIEQARARVRTEAA